MEDHRRAGPCAGHIHPHVDQRSWVSELSRYDAVWLHHVGSANDGDVRRATWTDLNLPARIPPLIGAGVPLLQPRSPGCVVAGQRLVADHGLGLLYDDAEDLATQLHDRDRMGSLRDTAWATRDAFTFDHHVDRLIALFRAVM